MGRVALNFTCNQVSRNDTSCLSVNKHQFKHLMAVEHLNFSLSNLTVHSRVGTEQELLSCLSLCIKGTGYKNPAKRPVVQKPAVITSKRHALCDTLVNDI